PPFPAVSGLYGSPTLINNVQTIATVPPIIEHGAAWYTAIGPETSPGTVVFSLSGNVERPGNYELELGTTLRHLVYELGGGIPGGRELKALIPGGSSTTVMAPDLIETPVDYNSVAEVGAQFGRNSRATSTRAAVPSAASRRWRGSSRPSTSTRTARSRRCQRDSFVTVSGTAPRARRTFHSRGWERGSFVIRHGVRHRDGS